MPGQQVVCIVALPDRASRLCMWPGLPWESPLFLFFVSAEGEAMCRNRLVLLGSLVACPQSGLGPACTACIPQGPGLQTSSEASCLVCSSVPGKPCHTQPGPLWVHPVSAVAVCLGAIGSGQICGCAVNFVLIFGRKLVAQTKGGSTKCQTQQWPSDVAVGHHNMK